MTWEATSFAILTAALIGGFAWYERSRPPSQVVALVAALAALAIAGRIAFAAFPNVKPTTDIVVFAGYALGPAPGFAVGALTALVSNFWFGQGPWTPWQMAGWGFCGVLGALLALGVRNAGRFALAAVCGLAGILYGVLLNFSLMATYGGDLSLERFLLLQSRAVPFDLAHVIGNVAFALIAGPAMVRMLVRFRERFEWRAPALATSTVLALLLVFSLPSVAGAADADRAASWLAGTQNADGGFGASVDDPSSVSTTAWVTLGLAATGRHPLDVARPGRTPIDFLRANAEDLTTPGDFGRTILALESAGVEPRSFGGRNLVDALLKKRRRDGSFVGWPGSTAFAVMALRAAGAEKALGPSLAWLGKAQNEDGGWGDLAAPPSTADGTGAVMQAMPESDLALEGLGYVRRHQRNGGGFVTAATGAVNTQSTAWAVQGMLAVGADPASIEAGGESALDYLATRQEPDGHYSYSASKDDTPVWVTGQVLAAVAGKAFPIAPPARAPEPSNEETDGGIASPGSISPPDSPSLPPPVPDGGTGIPPERLAPSQPPSAGAPPIPPSAEGGASEQPGIAPPTPVESEPVQVKDDDGPAPWAPLGIGLATGGLALGVPWWLGRRNGW